MTLRELINTKIAQRNRYAAQLSELRDAGSNDAQKIAELRTTKEALDTEIDQLEVEQRKDDELDRKARETHSTGVKVTEREYASANGLKKGQWVRSDDGRSAAVARDESFGDHEIVREHQARMDSRDAHIVGQHGSFGQLVRSMTTTSGSALVPTVWASDVIDRARNYAAVLQAGAQVVPMDAKVVQIGRLTADPTAAFRAEGGTITASDPTFDNVTLTANSMSALVVGSLEWFQDANNVDEIVSNAIAKAIGLQLDLVGLYGSITTGAGSINLPTPPNPRGILGALNATASSSVLGAAANGTTQTTGSFWNELLDLAFTPEDFNEDPGSIIWNSKAARKYAKTYDTQGQPLRRPVDLDEMTFYTSNQIPSYTQGTMTSVATDVFCGDFSQLLIGQRLDLTIQTLTERYAENGQVAIVANWRGDVGVARPRAFSVYKALAGA
jgi:HK97 family phage major capsid protein